jgi:hypothetical protein
MERRFQSKIPAREFVCFTTSVIRTKTIVSISIAVRPTRKTGDLVRPYYIHGGWLSSMRQLRVGPIERYKQPSTRHMAVYRMLCQ